MTFPVVALYDVYSEFFNPLAEPSFLLTGTSIIPGQKQVAETEQKLRFSPRTKVPWHVVWASVVPRKIVHQKKLRPTSG
jgi:hypothetical protein